MEQQTGIINNEVEAQVEKSIVKQEKKQEKELTMVDVLKMVAPGTSLRIALDDMLRAGMGALIVLEKEKLLGLIEGGFKVNCKFSAQRLVELAKMDGAIMISKDLKKILHANILLAPRVDIATGETGTRHKAAERTAKQIGTVTIAVSERKNKTTVYYKNEKHVLESTTEILRRATENLQILEKQKEIFDELLLNLNVLEINSLVSTTDVSNTLQRLEIIERIAESVKRYLIELGKEGTIVSMRLKELTRNLSKMRELLLKDYFGTKYIRSLNTLKGMNFDFLLESSNITRVLFDELHEQQVYPRGIRLLNKTNLLKKNLSTILTHFKKLDNVLDASDEELLDVLKRQEIVNFFKGELQDLKEKIMAGKKI